MSLSKQLSLGIFCILLIMFLGTMFNNISNTRDFISQQLSSHAQDTATSLGLSIMPYMSNTDDLVIAETMTQAIFDRGFYQSIEVVDIEGNIIIRFENDEQQENIPTYFSALFVLNAPTMSAEITDGWVRSGSVNVTSNTGIAYQQLWTNAVNHVYLSAFIFIFAIASIWFLVQRLISKPINTLIRQTEEISQQHFVQIDSNPSTTELKRFVNAINKMSAKLATFFSHITEQSEKYRLFAYSDMLTKVGNRRAFDMYLAQLLRNDTEQVTGYLFLIRASSLAQVHKELGGEIGDNYLLNICELCKKMTREDHLHFSIYRLNGADFALIIENIDSASAISLAKKLSLGFKRIDKTEYLQGCAHIGIASFKYADELANVLQNADSALAVASNNEKSWEISDNLHLSHSNEQWRDKIQNSLQSEHVDFAQQAIVDKDNNLVYAECFARIQDTENSPCLPMAQLIPASIRLDYSIDLDRMIVESFLNHLPKAKVKTAINLSRMSLFDEKFAIWLLGRLTNMQVYCHKLVIEISERALVHDVEMLCPTIQKLQELGVKIVVEHYGAQLAGIRHLRRLRPDYLKIDGRFTKNIDKEIDNQLFIQSLVSIAHGLHIKVIAEMIETEEELRWLESAKVDYFQGYQIATPQLLNSDNNLI